MLTLAVTEYTTPPHMIDDKLYVKIFGQADDAMLNNLSLVSKRYRRIVAIIKETQKVLNNDTDAIGYSG